MKIIRFSVKGSPAIQFGLVIRDQAVAFKTLQSRSEKAYGFLADSRSYLAHLPGSEAAAKELLAWGERYIDELALSEKFALDTVKLHEPVEVSALFDFGLTPRHLQNSAKVLMKYEEDDPKVGPLLAAFAKSITAPKPKSEADVPEALSFYKANLNSIVGDGETVPWPRYTSRLDVEPELAVVYGNPKQPVAGYCIFNDVSARDVQAPECIGGLCLTKDMDKGNQLGPYLVTTDEVGDPFKLKVTVTVNGKAKFHGSTSEISHKAEDIFAWLGFIAPLKSGNVMGFGTIPDCTGCDHDDFIDPGSSIEIAIERLGILHCRFAQPTSKLLPSRWPLREALRKYHN